MQFNAATLNGASVNGSAGVAIRTAAAALTQAANAILAAVAVSTSSWLDKSQAADTPLATGETRTDANAAVLQDPELILALATAAIAAESLQLYADTLLAHAWPGIGHHQDYAALGNHTGTSSLAPHNATNTLTVH
jgi:hypothetical protein